jgi:hypothetical protein
MGKFPGKKARGSLGSYLHSTCQNDDTRKDLDPVKITTRVKINSI